MQYPSDSLPGRFLSGDPAAHQLVIRWVAQVLVLPRFRLLRKEWSDVHQDVLGRVVESLRAGRFDRGRDFRVYVQGIARFTARDAVLRFLRSSRIEGILPQDPEAMPPAEELRLDARTLVKALEGMPSGCRDLFRLLYFQELGHAEIALRLGLPVGTVKSRLFRCLEKARELLLHGIQGS